MKSIRPVYLTLLITSLLATSFVKADNPPRVMPETVQETLPVVGQKITYAEVVDCGSVSQADLFRRARLWIAQSWDSSQALFSLNDKETGDLAGRVTQVITVPRSESSPGGSYTFRYSLVIECSNRKYRATITQVGIEDGNRYIPVEVYSQKSDKNMELVYAELDKHLKATLAALQENVKNYKAF
ncbi:hypothetical protein GCM10027341_49140 [Spirosoma knui]